MFKLRNKIERRLVIEPSVTGRKGSRRSAAMLAAKS